VAASEGSPTLTLGMEMGGERKDKWHQSRGQGSYIFGFFQNSNFSKEKLV
jgi:hypothetical protein